MKNNKNLNTEKTVVSKKCSFTAISSFIGTEIGDPYSHLAEKTLEQLNMLLLYSGLGVRHIQEDPTID